ncbi:PAS domain S-box protein [Desulfospira joergensenii]|uniref:PAS domain S-box protein n=1 Tax=Desulfospira joergensenii TaxID=53329 RepID=UPI0003B607F7|nr:PAS domain S-box protein [Desulfospira joergensenii]
MYHFDNSFSKISNCSHPHACIIYDNLDAYRQIASRYILEGLNANEKCIMAIDKYNERMIEADFADTEVDFPACIENGKLTIINVQESYSGNGGFDPDETIKIWQKEATKAVNEGYDALRVVGEATFSINGPELAEKLIYYENIINEILFPNFPFKSLCVYDKNLYNPEVIRTAISAHPILFYNDDLYLENIHYVPPEIHFKGNGIRDEIDIWLANVKRNNENLIALHESVKNFRSMFEKAPMSYQSLDENGNFIEVNETWLKVMGYERDEVISRNFGDFLHPDCKTHFKETFPRFKSVGEVLGLEFEMVKKDGSMLLVSICGRISKDNNELFKQTHCILQDITDRKRAEEELRKSEERYREIVEGTENLVTEVDIQGRLTFVNEACTKIFGLSPEECKGLKAFNFIHEDDREETSKKFDQWMKDKPASATFENRQMNQATGEARDMLWSINFVYNDKGEITSIKSIARDITERKRTEQKLIESERKLKDAQRLGRIGYWFWDIKTGEVEWTEEVFKLHGLDPETFTPHIDSILDLSPWPKDHQRGRELIQRAMENQEPGEFEQRFLLPDGSIGYYLSTFQGIYDENQKLIEMRGTAQDITERKKAEQELEKAHKELETRVEQRTKELSEIVQILKYRNHEIELLNEMGDLLQVCITENESYKTLSNICKKMWPDSNGFLGIFDKTLGLNTIEAFWGEAVQHNDPFSPEECWAFRRGKCHSIIDPKNDLTCEHMRKIPRHITLCIPISARGKTLGVLSTKFPILGSDVDRVQIVKQSKSLEAMAKRVTELFSLSLSNIRLRKDLYERSVRDSLTGLYNRLFMEESLSKELKIAERKGSAVSVIMMDVDHFKKFNDEYGHETGDEVLRRLGIAIPSFLRPSDIVCRYGGEEIIVIMPDCPLKIACDRAELIRSGIEDKVKIRYGGQYLQVTASFGVAEFNENYHSKEEFVSAADQALYLAKQAGRNTVQLAKID